MTAASIKVVFNRIVSQDIKRSVSLCGELYFPRYGFECDGYHYFTFQINHELKWIEAEDKCLSLGGHLVSINNEGEWQYIQSFFKDYTFNRPLYSLTTLALVYIGLHKDNYNNVSKSVRFLT
jgi:hypothetical protein